MITKTKWVVIIALALISSFVFAQTETKSVTVPVQPPQSNLRSNQVLDDQYLIKLLTTVLQSKTNADDKALINLLIQLLRSRQNETKLESLVTPLPGTVTSEPAPSLSPTVPPVFDEDRSDDNLVQINNLRITKITFNTSSDAKAYLYVVKDTGWGCVLYKSPESSITSACPLDIRKPIIQRELVVRVNSDTILLLRNRKRTDISQFNIGDKINVYGFFDRDNFTIDSLVVRKIVSSPQLPVPKPIVPSPVQPLPVPTSTPPIDKLPLRWFTGYLERIMPSGVTVESGLVTSSDRNQPTHYFTTDNNLVYSVRGVNETVQSLLEKYSNQRVKLFAFVSSEATANKLGSLLVKNVIPLVPSLTTTSITTNTERLTVKSVSGILENAGVSIYMWGSHILKADDGITYQVKALTKDAREALEKYTGKKVTIYAKKVYYSNLEGGFWAIEAEKVVPFE